MTQKYSAQWWIDRANALSESIDAADERPDDMIKEFNRCVGYLRQYATHIDVVDVVRCPENW